MSTQSIAADGRLATDTLAGAVASGARPPHASALAASLIFAGRALLKIKHVPEQLADTILVPVIFTLMFTYLFGGALAGSTAEYLQYLLPGTLVMAVVIVTLYSGVTLNSDIRTGAFDRFRSLPIWRPALLIGSLLGDIGRYLIASAIVIGLGLLMGYRPDGGPMGVTSSVALVIVFASSVSWFWLLFGMILRSPNAVQISGFVLLLPFTFASNVFVDPATTPGWLQAFIEVNPVSHLVTAVRGLMSGSVLLGEVVWVLAASAALVAVLAPLTARLYSRRT
jgi:ABC-2 type transport system permease protein